MGPLYSKPVDPGYLGNAALSSTWRAKQDLKHNPIWFKCRKAVIAPLGLVHSLSFPSCWSSPLKEVMGNMSVARGNATNPENKETTPLG